MSDHPPLDIPESHQAPRARFVLFHEVLSLVTGFKKDSLWDERIEAIDRFARRTAEKFRPEDDQRLIPNDPSQVLVDQDELARLRQDAHEIAMTLRNCGVKAPGAEGVRQLVELHAERTYLVDDLVDELREGTYRDPLEERLANPLRKFLGKPRHFAVKPAPDCTSVTARNGKRYDESHVGNGAAVKTVWVAADLPGIQVPEEDFLQEFSPFVEVLDD